MRRVFAAAVLTAIGGLPVAAQDGAAQSGAAQSGASWLDIRASLYADRPIASDGIVSIEAPYRAEDAALVPVTLRSMLPDGDPRKVVKLTLVIDENPSPVAATFTFGDNSGVSEIATRVRVNAYSSIHVVAELSDGSLHSADTFVKASGGCSAPTGKDPELALQQMGRMKFRQFVENAAAPAAGAGPSSRVEGQLSIRHPNNSGLQMDQVNRYYIPAHFISAVTVRQGDDLILAMDGGISISEDPSFRFAYLPSGAPIKVEVTDTEGSRFEEEWPAKGS